MNIQDTIYNEAVKCLGNHITLNTAIADDVGCAEAVSFVLKASGIQGMPLRGFAGTWDLLQWLKTNRQFTETVNPEYGGIVISATGTSTEGSTVSGHTGIILKKGIASNDSTTGIFQENYTADSWQHYFNTIKGFPVHYFCPVQN